MIALMVGYVYMAVSGLIVKPSVVEHAKGVSNCATLERQN